MSDDLNGGEGGQGGDAGAAAAAAAAAAQGAGAADAGAAPAAAAAAPLKAERPDYVPEKFWDTDAGTARLEDLGKSYAELERERGERTKRVPDDYQLPAGFKGFEDQIAPQQLAQIKALAKGEGYSQQGFEQLVAMAFGDPAAGRQALVDAFGDKTDETLEAVRLFAGTLGDHQDAVRLMCSRPEGVKLLNAWRLASVEKGLPGDLAEGGAKGISHDDLREKMKDPRYWKEKDPKAIAEVEAGFAALYPGQQPTAALNPMTAQG